MTRFSRSLRVTTAAVLLALSGTALTPLSATAATAASDPGAPAPEARDKRVIGAVHTDAVSTYLDKGRLVLDSRADIDIDGDGVVDIGSRIPTEETLFHLADASRTQVPDLSTYRFLGVPGSTIWMAPQTQNHDLIWPGFSPEDPALTGKVPGDRKSGG